MVSSRSLVRTWSRVRIAVGFNVLWYLRRLAERLAATWTRVRPTVVSPRLWRVIGISGVVAILALGAGAITLGISGESTGADPKAQIEAYVAAMRPLVNQGGRVIVDEVRPALADVDFGRLSPSAFQHAAAGWESDLERIRRAMDKVRVPSDLKPAAVLYDRAMRQYVAAIEAFAQASHAPPDQIQAAVTAAVPAATKADRTYDRADAFVAAQEKKVGLHPSRPIV